jgi:hypothetical protein
MRLLKSQRSRARNGKKHESPPIALHTEKHGDEEDPRREKDAHNDDLFVVLTSPAADVLLFCGQVKEPSYAAALNRLERARIARPSRLRIHATLASKSGSRTSAFVGGRPSEHAIPSATTGSRLVAPIGAWNARLAFVPM